MRNVARALVILSVLTGCDDDHEGSAQAKCETLVDTFCETVSSCADDADLLADDYSPKELLADCKRTVGRGAHCGDAKEVTSKYQRCLDAASEQLSCQESNQSLLEEDTFAIPAACDGVVRY